MIEKILDLITFGFISSNYIKMGERSSSNIQATDYFTKAINCTYDKRKLNYAYYKIANLQFNFDSIDSSFYCYTKAIEYNQEDLWSLSGRANLYATFSFHFESGRSKFNYGRHDALADLEKAKQIATRTRNYEMAEQIFKCISRIVSKK